MIQAQRLSRSRRRRMQRQRSRRRFETLEKRLLLAQDFSGVIDSNTTWNMDTNLVGDVFVRSGATLTISSGVNVTTNSPIFEIHVANDNTDAELRASNVLFDAPVILYESADGHITNSTIADPIWISGTDASGFNFSGNNVNALTTVQAEFVPRMANNTFAGESVIQPFGDIDVDTTWPLIPNVEKYDLLGDVRVVSEAILTLATGVTVSSQAFNHDLFVSPDGSGAGLEADDITLNIDETFFHATAVGSVINSTVSGIVDIAGDSASTLNFSDNTISTSPRVQAEFIPELATNSFSVGIPIDVRGIINEDLTWPNITNVSQYRLIGDVFVHGGSTLTLAMGTTVDSQNFNADLFIANDASGAGLVADDINLLVDEVFFSASATGSITNSSVGGILEIAGASGSTLNIGGNTINATPRVHAEYLPRLNNNTFAAASTIQTFGTMDEDVQWPNIPNVGAIQLIGDTFVTNAATLTIDSGVSLTRIGFVDLVISADKSAAGLQASGVQFGVSEIRLDESALGSITGSTIGSVLSISGSSSSTFNVSNNDINVSPRAHAEYVPRLANNTFAAASRIDVLGNVEVNTTWPNIPNVDNYRAVGDVRVQNGSRLTLASGIAVSQVSGADLFVSYDGSGAELRANNVELLLDVLVAASATGHITSSTIGTYLELNGTSNSTFTFNGNTINSPPRVHAEFVPRLAANTFVGSTVADVFGNIDDDITWPDVPGLGQYRLWSDIRVIGVGKLTIDRHVEVIKGVSDHLFIGDPASNAELDVTGAVIGADVTVFPNSKMKSRFTYFIAGSSLTMNAEADLDIHYNDFAEVDDHHVVAEGDPALTIDLTQNWWGTVIPAEIEETILHQVDEPTRPLVMFDPFLLHPLRIPDYQPQQLSVVSSAPLLAGSVIDVEYEIKNESLTGAGGGQSAALFYLNTNNSQEGAALLDFVAVENLAIDTTTGVRTVSLELPDASHPIWNAGLPRSYSLSMLVDASNVIMEFIEDNNTISTSLFVSPQVLTVTPTGGTTEVAEGGAVDELSVALASAATADVVVTADPDEQLDLGAGPGVPVQINFAAADGVSPKSLPVAAADDAIIEGLHTGQITLALSSTDPDFNTPLAEVIEVSVSDNDSVRVDEIIVNGGDAQRSTIDSIRVSFNSVVSLSPNAFELVRQGEPGGAVSVDLGTQQVVEGRTVVDLAFDPSDLLDGNYELRVVSSEVSAAGILLDGDADGSPGTDHIDTFFRFYGDGDGDRDVDGLDYLEFANTFLRRAGDDAFDPTFDFDADGDVDGLDYTQFASRFLKKLAGG